MNTATIDNEILTAAAFLAIGWDERMQKDDAACSDVKDRHGMGMDGLIAEVVQFAPIVEAIWRDAPEAQRDEFCGVWAYEMLEPMGAWIAEQMLADEDVTPETFKARALEIFEEHTGPFNEEPEDETQTPAEKIAAYNDSLNAQGIAPNGDDYNALLDLLNGGTLTLPTENGR